MHFGRLVLVSIRHHVVSDSIIVVLVDILSILTCRVEVTPSDFET